MTGNEDITQRCETSSGIASRDDKCMSSADRVKVTKAIGG